MKQYETLHLNYIRKLTFLSKILYKLDVFFIKVLQKKNTLTVRIGQK
jgi:hypothetical protein